MKVSALSLKSRLLGGGGTASGTLGAIGSIHNVCHSLCVTVVSILAIFGITTSILPLMFLQTYQMYFWGAALVFTAASFYFYLKQKHKVARDRNLLFINSGLLIFGLPFPQLADYIDFFRFIGISLVVVGILLFFFARKLQGLIYDGPEKSGIAVNNPLPAVSTVHLSKLNITSALFVLIVGGFIINQYFMYRMGIFDKMGSQVGSAANSAMKPLSKMKLTAFDVVLAKERMDKNNDGICDVCGMPIEQCIDSGQMDCNMGGNTDAIGILGSQHIHADFNVYVNAERLILAKPENYMKSSFMHLDNNQNLDDANSVLHMHAKNVPLWLFFKSIGMNLSKDSNILKFYLNNKKVDSLENYVFQDLDKILIIYGPQNDSDIDKQLNSMTNLAKDH